MHLFIRTVMFGLIAIILSNVLANAKDKFPSKNDVLSDAKFLQMLLLRYHPNITYHRTQSELHKIWQDAEKDLPNEPDIMDAATLMQKIQASVCDEHTKVVFDEGLLKTYRILYVPNNFLIKNEKLFFDREGVNFEYEITDINGKSNSEIISFLKSIDSADGCAKSKVFFSRYVNSEIPTALLLSHYLKGGKTITVKSAGDSNDSSTSGLDYNKIHYGSYLRGLPEHTELLSRAHIAGRAGIELVRRSVSKAAESYEHMGVWGNEKKDLYYIYIASFRGGTHQEEYINKKMRELVAAKPKKIIIDVAHNPGGSVDLALRFMSFLLNQGTKPGETQRISDKKWVHGKNFKWVSKNRKEIESYKTLQKNRTRYRKINGNRVLEVERRTYGNKSHAPEIVIVVGPGTGSAATLMAIKLKRLAKAKIVGSIGNVSLKTACFSAAWTYTLPKTNIAVRIPKTCIDRHKTAQTAGNIKSADIENKLVETTSTLQTGNSLRLAFKPHLRPNP